MHRTHLAQWPGTWHVRKHDVTPAAAAGGAGGAGSGAGIFKICLHRHHLVDINVNRKALAYAVVVESRLDLAQKMQYNNRRGSGQARNK